MHAARAGRAGPRRRRGRRAGARSPGPDRHACLGREPARGRRGRSPAELPAIGPLLETHDALPRPDERPGRPRRTARTRSTARVWERGVGETASSGTSARRGGGRARWRAVPNPGPSASRAASLLVRFESGRSAFLTGPAGAVWHRRSRRAARAGRWLEARLQVGRLAALADDQRALEPVGRRPGYSFWRTPGRTIEPGGTDAAVLHRLRAGDVDDRDRRRQDDVRARSPRRSPDDDALRRSPPASRRTRRPRRSPAGACGGSSTPPIPTPPARWTSAPICAQEPTVAQVSTIVFAARPRRRCSRSSASARPRREERAVARDRGRDDADAELARSRA